MQELEKEILAISNKEKAKVLSKYFKTGVGEYGEGDIFLGITVPQIRKLAKKYNYFSLKEIEKLLHSKFHEKRELALFILIELFNKKDSNKKEIINFYLSNTQYINNWDLVDLSCYKILGNYILNYNNLDYEILLNLANSKSLWERRISIVSTMIFVRNNIYEPTLKIAKKLLLNEDDLINKAVGWLLREVGKKDENLLKKFLKENIKDISKTTLNYSMEKFSKEEKEKIKLNLII